MIVGRHNYHNMLQFHESTLHKTFVEWVVFMKAVFSCLNLKPDDGFLLYRMSEVFNKTRNSITDIIIA